MPGDFSPQGLFEQSLVNLVLPFLEGETAKNGMLLGSNSCGTVTGSMKKRIKTKGEYLALW